MAELDLPVAPRRACAVATPGTHLPPCGVRREIVFVSVADLVADLVDESRFAKHVGLGVANLRALAGDGLFTAYNDEPNWRRAHDILAPAFTRETMQGYHPTMLGLAQRLIERWDRHCATGDPVDITGDMTRLTLETIAHTGFGYDFGSFERTEPHPFVTAMLAALRGALRQNIIPPVIGPLLTRRAAARHAADISYLHQVVDEVIAHPQRQPGYR